MKIPNFYRALHDYFDNRISPFLGGSSFTSGRFVVQGRRISFMAGSRRLLMGVISNVFAQLGETFWVDIQPPGNKALPSGTTATWTLTNADGYIIVPSTSATVTGNTISALITPPNAGVFFVNFTVSANQETIKYSVQIQVSA